MEADKRSEDRVRAYEDLLMIRVAKLFEAKDQNEGSLFDEVIDDIEMLFKLEPTLHKRFQIKKNEFIDDARKAYDNLNKELTLVDDVELRDIKYKKDNAEIGWAFRKDLLDTIIELMHEAQFLVTYSSNIGISEIVKEEVPVVEPPKEIKVEETKQDLPPDVESRLREKLKDKKN